MEKSCNSCSLSGKPKVQPTGNPLAPLYFIGEAPGEEEEVEGIPFCGKSGNDHWRIMRRYGITRDHCRVFNTLSCRPPDNDDPTSEQLAACRPRLEAELAQARPGTIIVTLGRFATEALLPGAKLAKMHGIPQPYGDKIIVPAYHPAAGLHQPAMLISYQEDMRAVAEILEGRRSRVHALREPIPYETSQDPRHLRQYLDLHSGLMSMDTETFADWSLYLISLAVLPELAYVFDVRDPGMLSTLQQWLQEQQPEVTMHNALFDVPKSRLNFDGLILHDTMLMAHILQVHPLKLKHLAYRLLGLHIDEYLSIVDPVSHELVLDHLATHLAVSSELRLLKPHAPRQRTPWKRIALVLQALLKGTATSSVATRWDKLVKTYPAIGQVCGTRLPAADLSCVAQHVAYSYTAQDAGGTYQLHHMLMAQLAETGLLGTYYTDMLALPMVVDMNKSACPVNRQGLIALGVLLERQLAETRDELPYNPMSSAQVAEMLRSHGLDTGKRTKSGAMSTGKKSLTRLKGQCAEIKTVLEYREDLKLKSAYVDGILEVLRPSGNEWTLTPNISMTRVPTGRLAASKPNVLAMPYRTDLGTAIRYSFYAPEGCVLVSLDYSSIELRVLAHHSQDAVLMDVFHRGLDPHGMTASRLFGKPVEAIDPKLERYPAKTIIFLIVYGGGASKLREELASAGLRWSYKKCDDLIHRVKYEVYPGVGKFLDREASRIRRTGESRDIAGRRRLIPQVYSTLPYIQEEGIRQGINNIIQSGAQSIIKRAMGEIRPICWDFKRQNYICDAFLQVHDELIFIISEEMAPVIPPLFSSIMVECGSNLSVPVEVDYAVGTTWGGIS